MMKVLFICSGNKAGKPGDVVFNQGESLRKQGIQIDYFTIEGGGFSGYFKSISLLRKYIRKNSYDILHAHYSLSAFTASLAKNRPLVVSLMGSDAYLSGILRGITKFFYRFFWDFTIVKSKEMHDLLKLKKAEIIPNGVDIERFNISDKENARIKLQRSFNENIIVFIADPARSEKNFVLAEESVKLLNRSDVKLLVVHGVPNSAIPDYMNAADLLLLTSKWEGSVNVVKEAMACNLPIVSTDVGDVKYNTQGVEGCFITRNNPEDVAKGIDFALRFNRRTNGREKLISMGLDSESTAKRIINVYKELIHV